MALAALQAVSAIVGAAALAFSIYNFFTSRALQKEIADQNKLMTFDRFHFDKMRATFDWFSKTIETIAEIHCELTLKSVTENEFQGAKKRLLPKLSSHIDAGRMFFPNFDHEKTGLDKQFAYRGVRHRALDALVFMYDDYNECTYQDRSNCVSEFTNFRREFVSEVQLKIDARRKSLMDVENERAAAGERYETLQHKQP